MRSSFSALKSVLICIPLVIVLVAGMSGKGMGQISIITSGAALTQNFDGLANSGTSSTVPTGWAFSESGTNANATYTAGTGSSNTGDTYSFGSASSTERAFGGLLSGSLTPTIGVAYTNNTGSIISKLTISFSGEQWRLGTLGRNDRLDFQYSTDAVDLTSGTWTDIDNLDFTAPTTTGTVGHLDGNAAANRSSVSYTITGLSIANGTTFRIRFSDFNATGADDGLGIDDWSLTALCSGLWTGITSTNWHTNTNWSDGSVPTSSTDVVVNSGGNQPAIGAAAVCNSLTINAGASVTNNNTLTMGGNLTGSGTFTNASGSTLHLGGNCTVTTFTTTATSNTVDYNGTDQIIRAGYYYHLQTSNGGTKTMSGYTDVVGVLGIGAGTTFATANNELAIKGDYTNGGTFNGGSSRIWLGGNINSTIESFSTTGELVLINSSGTKTLVSPSGAGSLKFGENGNSLAVNTTLTVGAVVANNAQNYHCTYTLSGSGTLSCSDFNVGHGGSTTASVTHTVNSTLAALVISNNLTVNSYTSGLNTGQGTFNHLSGTVTVNGSVTTFNGGASNVATYTMGNSSPVLNLGGTTPFSLSGTGTNAITLNGTGATVNYTRSGAQNILVTPCTNLGLSGGNTKTFTGITAISGNTSIASGTKADLGTYTSTSNALTLGGAGAHDGSWGGTGSPATYINTDYFTANTGILNVAVSTCVAPAAAAGLSNQTRCGDGDVTFSVTDPGSGYTVEWSANGSTNDDGTGLTKTKTLTVGSPVTVYARIRNNTTFCTSVWSAGYTGTAHPIPTITFTANTPRGSATSAAGSPNPIAINFCYGDDLLLSGYSSVPAAGVGVLESHVSSSNFPAGSGSNHIAPAAAAGFFSNLYSNFTITSGTSGTIAQTFIPYYDANNSGVYEKGIDCLGSEVNMNYTIYAIPVAAAGPNQALCNTSTFTMAAIPTVGNGEWTFVGLYGTAAITSPSSATTTVTTVPFNQDITLRWTETNGSCSSYDDVVIRNNSLPFSASGLANQTVTVPPDAESVTFSVDNPGAGYSVEWSTDSINLDGPPIAGSTPPVPATITISHSVSVGSPITEYARISNIKTGCKSFWGYDYHGTAYNGNLPHVFGSTRYGQSNGGGSDFVDKNGRLGDIPLLSNYGQDFSRVSTDGNALTVTLEWARYTGLTTAEAFSRIPVSSTPVLARGVCWGLTTTPDIYGPHTVDGSGVSDHLSIISGIDESPPSYYVRAWAINSSGLHYSDAIEITCGFK